MENSEINVFGNQFYDFFFNSTLSVQVAKTADNRSKN